MIRVIILIMLFLVILYVYTFIKIKKSKRRRASEPSFVEQYHKKYSVLHESSRIRRGSSYSSASDIQNYVTKYNSPVDYIEKK